jgi:hypothetical protein
MDELLHEDFQSGQPGRFFDYSTPSHLKYERIHGGIQEDSDQDEPMSFDDVTVAGTPVSLVLSDLLSGQGLNFYPEMPPAVEESDDEEAYAEEEPLSRLVLATYPAADLVAGECGDRTLIDMIRRTVEPLSWQDAGGAGTVDYQASTGLLYVNQTAEVQVQVRDFLTSLRQLNAPERGVREQVDGLVKAAKLALECGRIDKASELFRQIAALDAERLHREPGLECLIQAALFGREGANNCKPCRSSRYEPSLRPSLPGVDPSIAPAMDLILEQTEAKPAKLELVVEEECDATGEEMLSRTVKAMRDVRQAELAWESVRDFVPPECVDALQAVFDFHLAAVLDRHNGMTRTIALGWFGWELWEERADDGDR